MLKQSYSQEVLAAIQREQIRLTLRHLPTVQITAVVVGLILASAVRASVSVGGIGLWIGLLLAVAVSRIVYYVRYTRVRDRPFDPTPWRHAYILLAVISGSAWGVGAFLIFPSGNVALIAFFLLVFASLSAATTVSHSALRFGAIAWMTPALLGCAVRCFLEGGIAETVGFLILLYYAALVILSWNNYKTSVTVIAMGFENAKLLEDVRKSEERYHTLFNSMSVAIYLLDGAGGIVDVNKGAETLYREPRAFFLGRNLDQLLRPVGSNVPAIADAVRDGLAGTERQLELRGTRPDGTEILQEVRFMPATYGDRQVVIAIARDLSDRERIETEMLKAQKLEAVGVLAGGIAHDFNNLLQAMFSYLAVAKRRLANPDRAAAMLDKTEQALQMSMNLANQLLTFSKGGKPVMRPLDLPPVVETAARFALSGSTADCVFDHEPNLWTLDADEGQLGQLIQNVVLNAVQAMPGGGSVRITTRNVNSRRASGPDAPALDRWINVTVQDKGEGIRRENLQRIFEPYFTTKPSGSGLGLATSYSIARNHGGFIEVDSVEGIGSTFTIWLPARERSAAARERQTPSALPRRGRILVMDDEQLVRDSVRELLEELDQEVELAPDGAAAIDRYREARAAGRPYDLVILDATVRGGLGGEETLNRLRELDPRVVAVISSGYSDDTLVANHAAHGFRAFLPKPYTGERLQEVLSALMTN